ncbi:MAG: HNH endonuclease [Thermoplasmata archaeon]|nr:HNH endonuclease [Thermoplasmata archaeon]
MRAAAYSRRRAALVRDSDAWFGAGQELRQRARQAASCVECGRALASRRTPYCSRGCRWRFHGRYFWDAARRVVLRRDRYTCRSCGIRARQSALEVDHIQEIANGGAPLDYDNLQTLCRPCHRAKTVRFLRGRRNPLLPRSLAILPPTLEDGPEWFPA